jgi:ABC-type Mn2+/Zn2+ transport system ATPase subunit
MHALSIRNLTKVYSNGIIALRGIDLDVAAGDFFALLGPNGAGKTTAIGIVTSLVNKTSGTVSVFGHDLESDLAAAKSCIGVVPQEVNLNQCRFLRYPAQAGAFPHAAVFGRVATLGPAHGDGSKPLWWHETAADDCPGAGA